MSERAESYTGGVDKEARTYVHYSACIMSLSTFFTLRIKFKFQAIVFATHVLSSLNYQSAGFFTLLKKCCTAPLTQRL